MFTVKATYRNETRKLSFPESVFFPTYDELHQQLYRIFPISRAYYLSRLIFSPDASKPGRILIGKEVHSADDYDARVAPLRRLWPNPLLRFTILDAVPHEVLSEASQRSSLYSAPSIPSQELTSKPSPALTCHHSVLPLISCMPSPPSPPQSSVNCVLPPSPPLPPCNMSPPPSPLIYSSLPTKACSPYQGGTAGISPCCSITRGKADIHVLLSSFKDDLERILCRTLGTDCSEKPCGVNVEQSACRTPDVDVISPQTERASVGASVDTSSRWCFVCKTSFRGAWYGCIKCPWHAVCPDCFSKSHSAHTLSFGPSHVVQQHTIDRSTRVSPQIVKENDTVLGTQLQLPTSSDAMSKPALAVHRGILCDNCNKTVVGVRHKCLDCPDYDLCTHCMESGATERHNPFHEFVDLETPGRVHVHTVVGGDRDRSSENGQQLTRSDRTLAAQQEPGGTPTDLTARHPATCNLCDSTIVGVRYKCVVCPDFDTCSSCFRITTEQHPYHGFVKVIKPHDLIMRDSIPLRQLTHPAICDSCQKTIHGARYKCMHPSCPDFDLCSDCEALPIPVHPLNHPLLKSKTSDTVIPTVYRAGRTAIDEPVVEKSVSARSESRSTTLTSPLATTPKSPERKNVFLSGDVILEDQICPGEEFLSPLGSPGSQVLGAELTSVIAVPSHLGAVADQPASPQPIHPVVDIYHQLWPRVSQEMVHLNAAEPSDVGDSTVNPAVDAITESVGPKSGVAEELRPGSPPLLDCPATERHEMCPASPVPSTKSVVHGYRTPSSTPSKDQESRRIAQPSPAGDQQDIVTSQQRDLNAALVGDTNVPNGQIFPPGAEFVKGWHMVNNGGLPWPATTEVQFVAGELFAPECSVALRANVGVVHPGQDLDIWTVDLKAPDVPGRYVGYWRLSDGQGNFFGSSVWIDLTVADQHSDQASEQSLASSSMVMPSAHPSNSINASDEVRDAPQPSLPSTKTVTDEVEDSESDVASVFLVSVPSSDDDDAEWQDTRTHSEPLEYVVLYDSNSEE